MEILLLIIVVLAFITWRAWVNASRNRQLRDMQWKDWKARQERGEF